MSSADGVELLSEDGEGIRAVAKRSGEVDPAGSEPGAVLRDQGKRACGREGLEMGHQ
ncbi:hypothetical protein MASR1M66_01590 [Aminivibrio sp.]